VGVTITVRPARETDIPALIARYDERVAWLVEQGRTGQWGTTPFSEVPHWCELIASRVTGGDSWVAEDDGVLVGAITLGSKPPLYVEAVDEPEVYVSGLISAPGPAGRGVGAVLWQQAEAVARERGAALLRLDCYDGDEDDKLVRYYESRGFAYVRPLVVHFLESNSDYFGALMERRLDASSSSPDTSA
jgi:GNAT superfamily N-acetyltransferase